MVHYGLSTYKNIFGVLRQSMSNFVWQAEKVPPKTKLEINIKYFKEDYFHHRVLNYT